MLPWSPALAAAPASNAAAAGTTCVQRWSSLPLLPLMDPLPGIATAAIYCYSSQPASILTVLSPRLITHPADMCFKLPDGVSLEEGALCEPMSVAVHACRQAKLSAGHSVLILGAGPIGTRVYTLHNAHSEVRTHTRLVSRPDVHDGRQDIWCHGHYDNRCSAVCVALPPLTALPHRPVHPLQTSTATGWTWPKHWALRAQ